jgi:hypothetical protein
MEELPDLDRLSVAEKDELIRELWPLRALVRQLSAQVVTLTAKVAELEGRLALNSRNSSKPPSSGGYGKKGRKPKDAADADKKKSGGQKGHPGHTLKKADQPDHVVACPVPSHCDDGHLFISVLAYQFVQAIRQRLKAHGIHESWTVLREVLRVQRRVTASFVQKDGRTLHVRKTTRPEPDLRRLYDALGFAHQPGGIQKLTV